MNNSFLTQLHWNHLVRSVLHIVLLVGTERKRKYNMLINQEQQRSLMMQNGMIRSSSHVMNQEMIIAIIALLECNNYSNKYCNNYIYCNTYWNNYCNTSTIEIIQYEEIRRPTNIFKN